MVDLTTTYLGLNLKNPLIVSASPLSADLDNLRQMEKAGAAAVVLPSLFEEQLKIEDMGVDPQKPAQLEWLPEELKHIPEMEGYNRGVGGYIAHLYQAKKQLKIPVVASLNAFLGGGWVRYAKILEGVGADALELNIYYLASRPQITGAEIEEMYCRLVSDIKANVDSISVGVKIGPYFSSIANMTSRLHAAGADGFALFNRFYQPDFDIETQTITPSLELSNPSELRLRLRWVAMLYGRIQTEFAITGGVHSAADVLKCTLAGASAAMMTSALYKNGIDHLHTVLTDLEQWLSDHNIASLESLKGQLSQGAAADTAALERANYMNVLTGDNGNKRHPN